MSSVLTSADLNITRSSTRLHAPPGGHSSISFGSYEPPAARARPSYGSRDAAEAPQYPPRQQQPAQQQQMGRQSSSEAPVREVGRQKSANDSSAMSAIFGSSDSSAPSRGRFQNQIGGGSSAGMSDVFNHGYSNDNADEPRRGRKLSGAGASSLSFK